MLAAIRHRRDLGKPGYSRASRGTTSGDDQIRRAVLEGDLSSLTAVDLDFELRTADGQVLATSAGDRQRVCFVRGSAEHDIHSARKGICQRSGRLLDRRQAIPAERFAQCQRRNNRKRLTDRRNDRNRFETRSLHGQSFDQERNIQIPPIKRIKTRREKMRLEVLKLQASFFLINQ